MRKTIKLEQKNQKMVHASYSIFSLSFGLCRLCFLLGVFFAEKYYDLFTILGYIMGIVGAVFWVYIIETYLLFKKTKRLFSSFLAVSATTSLIVLIFESNRYYALIMIVITLILSIGGTGILLLYLTKESTGTARKKLMLIDLAILLIMIGHTLDSEIFISLFRPPHFPLFIAPLVMIGGGIIFMSFLFFLKSQEK